MDPTTTQNEYKYLAFSHKFFYRSSGDDFRKNYFPTYKILEIYEKYLKSVQLDPETIIKRFTTKQTPTIFVEFAKTGEGLVSFMNVLAAIASKQKISIKELFDKAVIFHILQARALNNLSRRKLTKRYNSN